MSSQSIMERERLAATRRQRPPAELESEAPPTHPLVSLGQQVGNAHVARMLAQRETMPEEDELQMSRDPALQREELPDEEEDELQMSRDPALQREAMPDEEEDELQMSRDSALQREAMPEEDELQMSRDSALQREAMPEEDELQMSREGPEVGPEGGPVSEATASQINRLRGGGSALDVATRSTMEQSLGDSFADVRVHTGSEAAQLNRSLGARAFTTGSDIFFGADASPGDKSLLAHELTHVSQQRAMGGNSGAMTVGAADDGYEQAAEATAAKVAAGAAPAQREAED